MAHGFTLSGSGHRATWEASQLACAIGPRGLWEPCAPPGDPTQQAQTLLCVSNITAIKLPTHGKDKKKEEQTKETFMNGLQ